MVNHFVYEWLQRWPSISKNYQDIPLQNTTDSGNSSKVMYIPQLTLKTWHSQVWCITLPEVRLSCIFLLLKLFWSPNLYFPRTDSRASLSQHTILLFNWILCFSSECTSLLKQQPHACITPEQSLHVSLLASLWAHRAITNITFFSEKHHIAFSVSSYSITNKLTSPEKNHHVWITKLQIQART